MTRFRRIQGRFFFCTMAPERNRDYAYLRVGVQRLVHAGNRNLAVTPATPTIAVSSALLAAGSAAFTVDHAAGPLFTVPRKSLNPKGLPVHVSVQEQFTVIRFLSMAPRVD